MIQFRGKQMPERVRNNFLFDNVPESAVQALLAARM